MCRLSGAIVAVVLVACTGPSVTPSPIPTPLVAAPGEILVPECPDNAGCAEGFVVGDQFFGLVCAGVDPSAVDDEPLATGDGVFTETRKISGIPSHLWLAVRGDIPCQPLPHEWFLAMNGDGISPAVLEEWGEAVGDVTLP